jgi:hypothetical protein
VAAPLYFRVTIPLEWAFRKLVADSPDSGLKWSDLMNPTHDHRNVPPASK